MLLVRPGAPNVASKGLKVGNLRNRSVETRHALTIAAAEEAEELREALAKAEREGRQLTEERQAAEEQELPLREWVKHIEDQVHAARPPHCVYRAHAFSKG